MTVDMAGAMGRGYDRVTTRAGAVLVGAFVLVEVASSVLWETVLGRFIRDYGTGDSIFAYVPAETAASMQDIWAGYEVLVDVGLPVEALIAVVVLLWLLLAVLRIGAIRWFVGEPTRALRARLFTRRIAWTIVNLLVGTVIYVLAIGVGLILLILPGIFVAVTLYFYSYEVVVEGENAIDALANSYAMTAGDRVELFLLGALFFLVGRALGTIGVPGVLPGRLVPAVIGAAATAAFGVYTIATAADVYRQLVESEAAADALEDEQEPAGEWDTAA